MYFGEYLLELRNSRGVSQKQLAKHVGLSDTYISNIEKGTLSPPEEDIIIKMAEFLNEDINKMMEIYNQTPKMQYVYKFVDKNGVILYIGKCNDLSTRIDKLHLTNQTHLGSELYLKTDKIFYQEYDISDFEIEFIERYYIKKYQPEYNSTSSKTKTKLLSGFLTFTGKLEEEWILYKKINKEELKERIERKIVKEKTGKDISTFTPEEKEKVLNFHKVVSGRYKERDLVILSLLINDKLKLKDLLKLKITILDDDNFGENTTKYIKDYLKVRAEPKTEDDKYTLFLAQGGKSISDREIQKIIKKYLVNELDIPPEKATIQTIRR